MWDHMQGYGIMGFGFGPLLWLLVIVGIALAIKWLVGSPRGGSSEPSAMEILKQRYASGEINEQEFHRMKKELEGKE